MMIPKEIINKMEMVTNLIEEIKTWNENINKDDMYNPINFLLYECNIGFRFCELDEDKLSKMEKYHTGNLEYYEDNERCGGNDYYVPTKDGRCLTFWVDKWNHENH